MEELPLYVQIVDDASFWHCDERMKIIMDGSHEEYDKSRAKYWKWRDWFQTYKNIIQ